MIDLCWRCLLQYKVANEVKYMYSEFKRFLSKFRLEDLIFLCSETTREMFNKDEFYNNFPAYNTSGRYIIPVGNTIVSAWGLVDIVYYAINSTNDYRGRSPNINDLIHISNQYNVFSNLIAKEKIKDMTTVEILYGLSQKQFWFQKKDQLTEQFNRNIELLLYIPKKITTKISVDDIVYSELGLTAYELAKILALLFGRGTETVDFTSVKVDSTLTEYDKCFTCENIKRVINYYTTDYENVQSSPLKENIFLTKPFIRTKSGKVFSVNQFYLAKKFEDGVYWVIRDFYMKQKSNQFVNEFGTYFEIYFEDLLKHYLIEKYYSRLKDDGKDKTADWIITTANYIVIIEQKSSLASLNTKREYTEVKLLNSFLQKFTEAFLQLNDTEKKIFNGVANKEILKFALHYETLHVQSMLKDNILKMCEDKISNKDNYFLVSISEMEKLIYALSTSEEKYENILADFVIRQNASPGQGRELTYSLEKFNFHKNDYLINVNNHFENLFNKNLL
jgi:hypothetical protein